ncbi:MAG: hypothetical protein AB7I41_22105 [Candidatus Sericytochromatia bacterium]
MIKEVEEIIEHKIESKNYLDVRIPALIIAMGLFSLIMLFVINRFNAEIFRHQIPIARLIKHSQLHVTEAHLWFEEYVSGDAGINLQKEVIAQIDGVSLLLTMSTQQGGPSPVGQIQAVTEADRKAVLIKMTELLTQWKVTFTRFSGGFS